MTLPAFRGHVRATVLLAACGMCVLGQSLGAPPSAPSTPRKPPAGTEAAPARPTQTLQSPAATAPGEKATSQPAEGEPVALNKQGTVLLDMPHKRLLLKTHVCFREGALELFCCLKQTKEHESILSIDTKAYVVHTGLLALGARPGAPAKFDPDYQPPTGQRIDIFVRWTDKEGQSHRMPAHDWVRYLTRRFLIEPLPALPNGVQLAEGEDLRYIPSLQELSWYGTMSAAQRDKYLAMTPDKAFRAAIERFFRESQPRAMEAHWVFAGSGLFTDDETRQTHYLAEDGDLICVSNFSSATLDVDLRSSNGNEGLLFEAFTERIPPRGTPVTVELIPVADPPREK